MKDLFISGVGIVGGFFAYLLGGWDSAMITLLIFMGADYLTGFVVAGIFKKSPKSENGALESRAGLKGLLRKGGMLLVVLVAVQLDIVLHTDFVRNAVIIAFIANETISLVENVGLMGVPIPAPITKAIALLKAKADEETEEK